MFVCLSRGQGKQRYKNDCNWTDVDHYDLDDLCLHFDREYIICGIDVRSGGRLMFVTRRSEGGMVGNRKVVRLVIVDRKVVVVCW